MTDPKQRCKTEAKVNPAAHTLVVNASVSVILLPLFSCCRLLWLYLSWQFVF
ncbi:hypothetical protein JHK82_038157 [Glycine max]|uniref:Uncharacterized protein n=1 Tax=Glycine max TaxID=3847 RepID=K7M3M9_SOYBN|nr:hypothetical protein JHK85_038909 [Glycine max]KAG5114888.1 hypothetical protein JHK82_038157 [Glycine max]KAG5132169.1 hypothetical protein JHK84_038566 [Glycine max]KRH23305.1 hypothetical protein GLYMA_13G349400v4 [Glycine max]